jgi:hypothetical protein
MPSYRILYRMDGKYHQYQVTVYYHKLCRSGSTLVPGEEASAPIALDRILGLKILQICG